MAIDVTDELRQAVYAADCEANGHLLSIRECISNDPDLPGLNTPAVRSEDPEKVPHLSCQRCGKVWLVIEDAGDGYDDAVQKVTRRLKDPSTLRVGRQPRREKPPALDIGDVGQPHKPHTD